jgi:hypothetical protein
MPVKRKRDLIAVFEEYLVDVVYANGHTPRFMIADSEKIFLQWSAFRKKLLHHKIKPLYSAPYRHEQSLVERSWRTIKGAAVATMASSRLPSIHWDIVVPYGVIPTWNALPSRSNGYRYSPYERMTGNKPNVSTFVPLGSRCYVYRYIDKATDRSMGTFRPRATEGRILGYPDHYKGAYYVLNADGAISVRRDVVTDESVPADDPDLPVFTAPEGADPDLFDNTVEQSEHRDLRRHEGGRRSKRGQPIFPSETNAQPFPPYWDAADDVDAEADADESNQATSVDMSVDMGDRCAIPRIIPDKPKGLITATSDASQYNAMWRNAAAKELAVFSKLSLIEIVDKPATDGHRIHRLFAPCVYKVDRNADKLIAKVRIVFDGSTQIQGLDYERSDSPTLGDRSLKIILHYSRAASMRFKEVLDVDNAYLKALDESEFFVQFPSYWKRPDGGAVYGRLIGNMYGKCAAGRIWYFDIDALLLSCGWERTDHDPCVYVMTNGDMKAILGMVVDDIMITSTHQSCIDDLKVALKRKYGSIKEHAQFKEMTGVQIKEDENGIHLSQSDYISKVTKRLQYTCADSKSIPIPISSDLQLQLMDVDRTDATNTHHAIAGTFRWLADKTRYDICFATHMLARYQTKHVDEDDKLIRNVLKYCTRTAHYTLKLGSNECVPVAYSDASYNYHYPKSSVMCWVIYLSKDSGAVIFRSVKSHLASLSSTHSEIAALVETVKDVLWVRGFMRDLGKDLTEPTVVYCDSDPALTTIESINISKGMRYLTPKVAFLKEQQSLNHVIFRRVSTEANPADLGTKALSKEVFHRHTRQVLEGIDSLKN